MNTRQQKGLTVNLRKFYVMRRLHVLNVIDFIFYASLCVFGLSVFCLGWIYITGQNSLESGPHPMINYSVIAIKYSLYAALPAGGLSIGFYYALDRFVHIFNKSEDTMHAKAELLARLLADDDLY